MASTLSVAAEGKRVTVRVTPMQPLSAILTAAAAALQPPIAAANASTCCSLKVNGKVLTPAELGTPIRFANLSAATTKLELVTGRERGLGVNGGVVAGKAEEMATAGSSTTSAAVPAAAAAAAPQPPPPPPPAPVVPAPIAMPAAAGGEEGPSSTSVAAPVVAVPPPPAAAPATAPPLPPPPPPPAPPPSSLPPRAPLPPPPKPIDSAVVIEASVRTHLCAPNGGIAGLGLEEKEVAVFSRDDLEKAAAEARGGVPLDALASSSSSSTPDSFFEFTPEDYRAVLGSYRGKHEAAASAPLKTSTQRAAEAKARAVAAGDVRLRVHFLDRSILQFRLPATAPLGVMRELVSRALERRGNGSAEGGGGGGGGASTSSTSSPAHLAPWEWEIYTAPPKTVLRPADDAKETLFSLGLSPAANVHCGPATASGSSGSSSGAKATTTTAKEAPRLRPELLALRQGGVVPMAVEAKGGEEEAKGGGGGGAGGGSSAAAANTDVKGKGKAGMPKWMKMGK
jgi:hypothetical protein